MSFQMNYFLTAPYNIIENDSLREPQILAFVDTYRHFIEEKSSRDAIIILPTGAGKTGVMGLVPYGISQGRVLIITPQLVIKDHVLESLDPSEPKNFWLERNVFQSFEELPIVTEYDKNTHLSELENSNIIILNIHKVSSSSRNSLLKKVPTGFFDMILIDEAHHSPAETWQKALNYFSNAKVVKVTGTPFRTDRKPIEGKVVTEYRLGRAMQQKIVKSLERFKIIPEKLKLIIDKDPTKTYTIEELYTAGIKDENYITRSVAFSPECNQQIVDESIRTLEEKRLGSVVPHKIIAVACSIEHAEQIKQLYISSGLRAQLIHSDLMKPEKEEILREVENHRCDVIIHVAMLGEGYDHPYLSIAAIFRPFKSLAPYSQFIGRILRYIPDDEISKPSDNIGTIIAHKDLNLEPLWEEYQKELEISQIIEKVREQEKFEKRIEKELNKSSMGRTYNKGVALIEIDGDVSIETDYYVASDLIKENELFEKELQEKIESLKRTLPNIAEQELRKLILSQEKPQQVNPLLKNPKKYRMLLRQKFHNKIYEDIPAYFISKFEVKKEGRDFARALPREYQWICNNQSNDNAAIISIYFNKRIKEKFGERDNWLPDDYNRAEEYVEELVEHTVDMFKTILRKGW